MDERAQFRPSVGAFAFRNSFPAAPAVRFGPIRVGNVSGGLCGGMVFAARDYWQADAPVPARDTPPEPRSALQRFLVRRLVDSWHLPFGWLRYYWWSLLPFHRRGLLSGTLYRSVRRQWPRIRAEIDSGAPSPIGLVVAHGANPRRLIDNHQVLAYDYTLTRGAVRIAVYDPNSGPDDSRYVQIPADGPITHNIGLPRPYLHGLFRVRYRFKQPPLARPGDQTPDQPS